MFDNGKFGDFLGFERTGVIEDFAVAVSENISREPAAEAEAACAQAGGDDGFHQGLARLEILAHNGNFIFLGKFYECRGVDGEVGGTVGIGITRFECGIGVNHRRGDVRVILFEAFFEGIERFMDICHRRVNFG